MAEYTTSTYPEYKRDTDADHFSSEVEERKYYGAFKDEFERYSHLLTNGEKAMWWETIPQLNIPDLPSRNIDDHPIVKSGGQSLWPRLAAIRIMFVEEEWKDSWFANHISLRYPDADLTTDWPNIEIHTGFHPEHAPRRRELATDSNKEGSVRSPASNTSIVAKRLQRIREMLESPAKRLQRSHLEQLSGDQLAEIPRVMELETKNKYLQNQVEELQDIVACLEVDVKNHTWEYEEWEMDNRTLRKRADGLEEKVESLKEEVKGLKKEAKVLKTYVDALEDVKADAQKTEEQLEVLCRVFDLTSEEEAN